MVSLRQYYVFALWLPLIIPAIFLVAPIIPQELRLAVFMVALVFGVQYVMFAIWASCRHRNSTAEELAKFGRKAPLLFVPFCMIWFVAYIFYEQHYMQHLYQGHDIPNILSLSFFAIPIGYFYVGLAHILTFILKKLKVIKK